MPRCSHCVETHFRVTPPPSKVINYVYALRKFLKIYKNSWLFKQSNLTTMSILIKNLVNLTEGP